MICSISKKRWVHGYRNVLVAAANKFDIPAELLAGIAYNEVGGDPDILDTLAYSFREKKGRKWAPWNKLIPPRDETSFGKLSIQIRRAAEALGYGSSASLNESQRRAIIASLKDPVVNIFIAAKHISDLRNVDFRGVSAHKLTKEQIEVIAARYNYGPERPLSKIEKDLDYGKDITKRWSLISSLIK